MTCYLVGKLEGMMIATSILFAFLVSFSTLCEAKDVANPAFDKLRCYQCNDQVNNTYCSRPTDLFDCQTEFTSNVCSTKTSYTQEKGLRITKSCDTGPCTLDNKGSIALNFDKLCDRTKPSWVCSSCCSGEGCNINAGHQMTASLTTMVLLTVLPIACWSY